MKLIIQIPCKNEEDHLPQVIKELPKQIEGIDIIEYQVIDDGSTDKTSAVAKKLWVHHIIRFTQNKGLWFAFKEWVNNALKLWADIVVNTDADNQYPSKYIAALVKPILAWTADIVIWDRSPTTVKHFSPLKKLLQWLGNVVVSYAAGMKLQDSVSGFRAYSRDALMELNVTSRFSYVVDTIVQAAKKWLKIQRVPITVNLPTRQSRLFSNIFQHIKKTTANLIRVYIMYEPFKVLLRASLPFVLLWGLGIARFIYYYIIGTGAGKIQSLIISGIVIQIGLTLLILWVVADLIAKNRFLIEENLKMMKKMKYSK